MLVGGPEAGESRRAGLGERAVGAAEVPHEPMEPITRTAVSTNRRSLVGLSREALRVLLHARGLPMYRGTQVYEAIYRRGARSFDEVTSLPIEMRRLLAGEFSLVVARTVDSRVDPDGTEKHLVRLADGAAVEVAVIPEGERRTLCLSTQVGCRRRCAFCRTGRQGLTRNMTAGEIVSQLLVLPNRERITNIVFMGMGEPLDNVEEVLSALALITNEAGIGFPLRRITVSTVGIHPALERFVSATPVNLAVSLHSAATTTRRRLMPVENAHPIAQTLAVLTALREDRRRRLTFEYALFRGVNDDERHAAALVRAVSQLRCRVNLIPYHRIPESDLLPANADQIERFRERLAQRGLRVFVRRSRGESIGAACGLLWTGERGATSPLDE